MAHLKGRSKYSSTAHSQNHPNLFCGIRVILIISRYDVTGCDSDNGKKHYPGKGVAPAEPLCRIWREISTAPFQGLNILLLDTGLRPVLFCCALSGLKYENKQQISHL